MDNSPISVSPAPCRCNADPQLLEVRSVCEKTHAYAVHCPPCDRWGPPSLDDKSKTVCVALWNQALTRRPRRHTHFFTN